MARLRQEGRKALVPYMVAGDLSRETTLAVMHAVVEAGANLIELAVPFSDPAAEGPTIQRAHERALANKVTLREVLSYVKEFRERDQDTPIMLMGYANPVERMGYETFVAAAKEAGLDGVLTVDLPPEEAEEFKDRKSTRLNSSHVAISYAVFCLKKKRSRSGQTPAQ